MGVIIVVSIMGLVVIGLVVYAFVHKRKGWEYPSVGGPIYTPYQPYTPPPPDEEPKPGP